MQTTVVQESKEAQARIVDLYRDESNLLREIAQACNNLGYRMAPGNSPLETRDISYIAIKNGCEPRVKRGKRLKRKYVKSGKYKKQPVEVAVSVGIVDYKTAKSAFFKLKETGDAFAAWTLAQYFSK